MYFIIILSIPGLSTYININVDNIHTYLIKYNATVM